MPIELHNPDARVLIYPEYGAMVNSFLVRTPSGQQDVIFGYDPHSIGASEIAKDFRSSILSPYPNRVKAGQYTFQGQTHQLDLNFAQEGNSIHGLLYDQPFEVVLESKSKLVLIHHVQKDRFKGYPFAYTLEVTYTLKGTCLGCAVKVLNASNQSIPMSFGVHPYFRLADSVGDLDLKLPSVRHLEVDDAMIPTGQEMDFNRFEDFESLKSADLDDGFRIVSDGSMAETHLRSGELLLTLRQEIGEGKYNFLQVYTPPHRKSIAIEPMIGPANCFNSGAGLTVLEAGQKLNAFFEIEVSFR